MGLSCSLKGAILLVDFPPFLQGGQHFLLPICLLVHQSPSGKGSTLKGKNLLPEGTNTFFLGQTPFQKEEKIISTELSPLKMYHFALRYNYLVLVLWLNCIQSNNNKISCKTQSNHEIHLHL